MIRLVAPWVTAGCCAVFGLVCGACHKEKEGKAKASKKPSAVHAAAPRQALNAVARILRELAETPPEGTTPAARASSLTARLQAVPAADLPDSLRAAWQEMTMVLESAGKSGPGALPPPLRKQGEAAAAALNAALAAEGLTEFRF